MKDEKKKILIIEDDIPLGNMYEARLKMEGYQVSSATEGEEGIVKAKNELPDLIILDIMLPKVSGVDVLDILKSTPETKDIPVIILTALTGDKIKKLSSKVEDLIFKSEVTLEEVIQKINKLMGK